jgi:elongation factor Ts
MPEFTAKDVQSLRQATGAGMMDAKRALQDNDGDFDAAVKWLREKGLGKAAERSDRENAQGAIAVTQMGQVAAVVELRCETDFVAKSENFIAVTQTLADAVAAGTESSVDEHKAAVDDLKVTLKENIEVGAVARVEAAADNIVDTYLHKQDGRGVNAVVVELEGGTQELAHDVAIHIAFAKPTYLSRDEVPDDVVAAERETLTSVTRAEGKPEAALEKIVDGRLNGWFKDRVLLEQGFARDDKTTMADLVAGGGGRIVRFAQVLIGA